MSPAENPDIERAWRAARAAGARVDELDGRVTDLDQMVAQLAQDITATVGDTGGPVRSWILADDPEQTRALLVDLAEWLDRVYLTYRDTGLPSCWMWHPAVVEELLMLRHLHADAYGGKSWSKVGDWHDRWLPGVRDRIEREVGTCRLERHQLGKQRPKPVTPMVQHLDAVVDAWMSTGRAPQPSTSQLNDARELDAEAARQGGWRDVSA